MPVANVAVITLPSEKMRTEKVLIFFIKKHLTNGVKCAIIGRPTMVELAGIFNLSTLFKKNLQKIHVLASKTFLPKLSTPGGFSNICSTPPGGRCGQNKPHMRSKPIERAGSGSNGPNSRSVHPIWIFFLLKAVGHMATNFP